jgi:predicted GNAT family N-acyltransferase
VEVAEWARAGAACRAVREAVFVHEQGVPPTLEWDAADPACAHVLARDGAGAPVGTARLTAEGRVGRMAVLPAWRGQGVGTALLAALLDLARARGLTTVRLSAQLHAVPFYARRGFEPDGPVFTEAGILHRRMSRRVDADPSQ